MANILGDMLVRIIGDKSSLDKALSDSEKATNNFGKNVAGNLKSQLKDLDDVIGGLGSKMIKLLSDPVVLATTALVGMGKAIVDSVKDLEAYGSQMLDMSERTGLSITSLQEYKYIAEQTGSTLESITNAVKLMTRGLETNDAVFVRLGVTTKDANGEFRSTSDIFNDTIGKLAALTNDTERSNLALQLFGRGALDLVPILKLGANGVTEMKDKAHALGLVMSDEVIRGAENLGDATKSLTETWAAWKRGAVQDTIPAWTAISNAIQGVIQKVVEHDAAVRAGNLGQAYAAGKASVVEYHDALAALVAINNGYINSETASLDQKNKAISYNTTIKATMEALAPAYDQVIASQKALNSAQTSATNFIQNQALKAIADKKKAEEDAAKAEADAVWNADERKRQADTLFYSDSTEGALEHKFKLAQYAAAEIEDATNADIAIANADSNAATTKKANALATFITQKQLLGDYSLESNIITDNIIDDNERQIKEGYQKVADFLGTTLVNSAESFGEALALGKDPAKAFFKTVVDAVGNAVLAYAALVEAQGWATWPISDWSKIGAGIALGVLGGTIKGYAASMAQGGVASSPTLAMVGDNRSASEAVIPLTSDVLGGIGDGIVAALASRSRPVGVTEASVAAMNSQTISSSSTIQINLGAFIGDDASLRKFERTLRSYGLKEDKRVGK